MFRLVFAVSLSALVGCATTPADLRGNGTTFSESVPVSVALALENTVKNGEPCIHEFSKGMEVISRLYSGSNTALFAVKFGSDPVALLNVDYAAVAADETAVEVSFNDFTVIDNPPAQLFAQDVKAWASGERVCTYARVRAEKSAEREKRKQFWRNK